MPTPQNSRSMSQHTLLPGLQIKFLLTANLVFHFRWAKLERNKYTHLGWKSGLNPSGSCNLPTFLEFFEEAMSTKTSILYYYSSVHNIAVDSHHKFHLKHRSRK